MEDCSCGCCDAIAYGCVGMSHNVCTFIKVNFLTIVDVTVAIVVAVAVSADI